MVGPRVTFLIPALNEAQSLSILIPSLPPNSVVVVDDGSTDHTLSVSQEAGAIVLRHEDNRGYDAALETGLEFCYLNSRNLVVTLDADGQHDPKDAARAADALAEGLDFCIGIRPSFSRITEGLMSRYFRRFHGITDPLCGLKGYNLGKLSPRDFAELRLSIGTGLISRFTARHYRVLEFAISIRPRALGKPRFGVGLRPNVMILRALLRQVRRDSDKYFQLPVSKFRKRGDRRKKI